MLIYEAPAYAALIDPCRDYLLSLVEEGEGKPVRRKFRSDPGIYGGLYVAMTVHHALSGNFGVFRERPHMPGFAEFVVAFKDLALSQARPNADWRSRTEDAEASCEAAFSAWVQGLEADPRMDGRVFEVEIVSVEAGAQDRLGNAFVDLNSSNQLLWALQARVRIVFAN